jgi:glycosyltransferase involved in cell wall biosynthesis
MARPRIIAFAYACEPEAGSEPGAGWEWACMLAAIGDVWVITRENNRQSIEAALPFVRERSSLHFVYLDLPARMRFWKRGQRGVRLYYVLWQAAALRRARSLAREVHADLIWHLTLANAWVGSTAPLSKLPFVYGPVGGGVGTPWRMMAGASRRAIAYEAGRVVARTVGRYANPVARVAFSRATLILVQNEDTKRWLPERHRGKSVVFPNVVIRETSVGSDPDPGVSRRPTNVRTALFAGRLIHWKGANLAVSAVARAPGWRLIVCGTGSEESELRRLADELGCADRVEFVGWMSRTALFDLLEHGVDALLFPSLHDEAGWIVVEALVNGVPVVCCDRGGPPAIAGSAGVIVTPTTPAETVTRLAAALNDGRMPTRSAARRRGGEFTPGARTATLRRVLHDAGLVDGSDE